MTGLAVGAAHARAQAPEPGGTTATGGIVQGGAIATLSGSGDDATVTYATGGGGGGAADHLQLARPAGFTGSDGEGKPKFAYGPAPRLSGTGREARLTAAATTRS